MLEQLGFGEGGRALFRPKGAFRQHVERRPARMDRAVDLEIMAGLEALEISEEARACLPHLLDTRPEAVEAGGVEQLLGVEDGPWMVGLIAADRAFEQRIAAPHCRLEGLEALAHRNAGVIGQPVALAVGEGEEIGVAELGADGVAGQPVEALGHPVALVLVELAAGRAASRTGGAELGHRSAFREGIAMSDIWE
ncbi:MAG TPA: hypothetical protein VM325_05485 [Alphaproteobacteria bacterium]|nr:hypothetical protein [Alphaproteobacteria bacterium]